jgi:hypothetical protein
MLGLECRDLQHTKTLLEQRCRILAIECDPSRGTLTLHYDASTTSPLHIVEAVTQLGARRPGLAARSGASRGGGRLPWRRRGASRGRHRARGRRALPLSFTVARAVAKVLLQGLAHAG